MPLVHRRIGAPLLAASLATVLAAGTNSVAHAGTPDQPRADFDFGTRTLTVQGTAAGDTMTISNVPGAPRIVQVDLDNDGRRDFAIPAGLLRRIEFGGGDGNDNLRVEDAAFAFTATVETVIDGGSGEDVILGGVGAELLKGGDGADKIDPRRGDDSVEAGPGDDRVGWAPGDGSDAIEGQEGQDELFFVGSAGDEQFAATSDGPRVRFTRDIGAIAMDLGGVEVLTTLALGGQDGFVINDLSGTEVNDIVADLAVEAGGTAGDQAPDSVRLAGTASPDFVEVSGDAAASFVFGLPALVRVLHADPDDVLTVDGADGDDSLNASSDAAGPELVLEGGDGGDTLLAGNGDELLIGDAGDDFADGNRGNDTALLGEGDDIFRWEPGDGSDTVEGQAGHDVQVFVGANVDEPFDVAANGSRVQFLRQPGNIRMNLDGIEKLDTLAQGGADTVTIGDLSGTAVTDVEFNLSGIPGGPASDNLVDRVTVNGTNGDDAVAVVGSAGTVDVTGLPGNLRLTRAEPIDELSVLGGVGSDTLDDSGLAPGTIVTRFFD